MSILSTLATFAQGFTRKCLSRFFNRSNMTNILHLTIDLLTMSFFYYFCLGISEDFFTVLLQFAEHEYDKNDGVHYLFRSFSLFSPSENKSARVLKHSEHRI